MSGTSEIGAMYRQLLAARGVPANGDNMRRVVEESRRTPGLIPGLTVEGMDQAPPNQAAASMPTQSGVPNSGVAPPMTPQPTQPLPVPPAPPSAVPQPAPVAGPPVNPAVNSLPSVDQIHPGATSPSGVIPGTTATPSSPMSAAPPPMSAQPTAPSAIAQQVLGGTDPSQSSSPMSMSLPHMSVTGSLPGLPQPSPAGGGMDSSDIAQLILGLGATGAAGVLGPWASAMHGPSGGGAEYMGNAGYTPFNIPPDRQAPTARGGQPTGKAPSGAPDRGPSVGQSGNSAADIERPGSSPTSPITSRVGSDGKLRLEEGGSSGGAVTKTNSIPMRDETSGPPIRGQNQGSGPPIATEAPSLDRQAQLAQQARRVGRTPSIRGLRFR